VGWQGGDVHRRGWAEDSPAVRAVKVLLSAFACEPGRGSELEAGYRVLLAAARRHEVWVLTLPDSVRPLETALRDHPRRTDIHLEGVHGASRPTRLPITDWARFQLDYDRWQRMASERGHALDREIGFDVIHHATVSSYWTRLGVGFMAKPIVWGPVGGGVDLPLSMLTGLGLRGAIEGVARLTARPIIARLPAIRRSRANVRVAFVQNRETARRLRGIEDVRVVPNAISVVIDDALPVVPRTTDIVFAGRLVAWKGPMLALSAFRRLRHRQALMWFCGVGPEMPRLQRAVREWGLRERVRFEGYMPRADLLRLIHRAGVLVHPALQEEGGLAVAEALALGTPVVCLDRGGPAELVRHWPETLSRLITVKTWEETAESLAMAIDSLLSDLRPPATRSNRASTSFDAEILAAYDSATSTAITE
jgi:glycosyltransferase involved in cell wall biosynthesis